MDISLTYKQDKINKIHYHVFLGKFEIGSIHGPLLKNDYVVYIVDNYKQMSFKSFDECINYIGEYLNG